MVQKEQKIMVKIYKFKAIIDDEIIYPKGIYYQGKFIILVGCTENGHTIRRKEKIENVKIEIDRMDAPSASLLVETIFLLRKNQPNKCPEWIKDIGDCKQSTCEFCRIEKCIDALENNALTQGEERLR